MRLKAIEATVGRLRILTQKPYTRLVTVNIPEAEAVEDGMVADRYRVIVGAPEHPSPVLSARIIEVNFHPTWTVPLHIAREEIIQRVREDPDYLAGNGFHLYGADGYEVDPATLDWSSDEPTRYTFRQDPGPGNPMGNIRLNMPNSFMVYMHDTPAQELFRRSCRLNSAGCVRVEHIERLAAWLLEDTPDWDSPSVEEAIDNPTPQDIRLAKPVPVEWVYFTAWATPNGITCFRPDVYNILLSKPH
jgi:murein L,D-transpeptidase YcbB/YkuD